MPAAAGQSGHPALAERRLNRPYPVGVCPIGGGIGQALPLSLTAREVPAAHVAKGD